MQFSYKDYDGNIHYVDEHNDNVKITKTAKYVTIDWSLPAMPVESCPMGALSWSASTVVMEPMTEAFFWVP